MTDEILIILLILEIIGTVAFAISGSLVAIKSKYDVLGIIILGCINAVGGGLTRDVIIGLKTPIIFDKLYLLGIAALTSLIVFIFAYVKRKTFNEFSEKLDKINNVFSSIGLATFTVIGVETAFSVYNISDSFTLSIVSGILPGVGGGLMRDVITNNPPYVFTKHFYLTAAVIGSIVYYYLRIFSGNFIISSIVGVSLILVLRFLATKFYWRLPKIQIENNENKLN